MITSSKHARYAMVAIFAIVFLVSCSGSQTVAPGPDRSQPAPIRMQHQVAFYRNDDVQVFDGYLILSSDTLLVKAFAGPGVDLFTVVRGAQGHCEALHLPGLKDKIDIQAVAGDIARAYLGRCVNSDRPGKKTCQFLDEPMVEIADDKGRIIERRFPKAHGIGLTVRYEDFRAYRDRIEPTKVTLTWGKSKNRMIIRVVDLKFLEQIDPAAFTSC
ncbi:MAG: hypothetical protein QNJ97_24155 [Myxococcota bacterium]|nr:hypothetical protein [Myxococcota bacterium]